MASTTDILEISSIDETSEYIANNLSGLVMTEELSSLDSNVKSFLITHPDIEGRVRLMGNIMIRDLLLDNMTLFYTPDDTSRHHLGISYHNTKEQVLEYIQELIGDGSDSDDSDDSE